MFRQLFVLFSLAAIAQALKFEKFEEGTCLEVKPVQNVDETLMSAYLIRNFAVAALSNANFRYISGGSKHYLYRVASSHPRFEKMRDFEFYYDACLQTYTNISAGLSYTYGFGDGVIGYYLVKAEEKNVIYFVSLPTPGMEDVARHTITLTDNKSFIVLSTCYKGSDQRGWVLVTTTPSLDEKTQKLIEEHMESNGFDREQFVFLQYDNCGSVVPGAVAADYRRGRMTAAELNGHKFKKGRY